MTILASDNFTRANNADLGAAWDPNVNEGSGTFTISSNTAVPSSLGGDLSETNNTVSWPNDQYAEVTLGTTAADGAGAGSGPTCREATGSQTYYRLVGNASGYGFDRCVNGTFTILSSGTGTTFVSGDKLRLEVKTNGANADWVLKKNGAQFASGSDASPIASGRAGIGYSSTSTVATLLTWEGGDFVTASAGGNLMTMGVG